MRITEIRDQESVDAGVAEPQKKAEKGSIAQTTRENAPDNALVNNAYSKLQGIFTTHYINALLDAGRYIIDNFYDGKIELARQRKPQKAKSLSQLIDMLKGGDRNSPSRSWIFNAVSLVIEEDDCKSVHTYGQLPKSHRVILLAVKEKADKIKLIEEVVAKKLTVIQLKKRISELIPAEEAPLPLVRLIGNPNILFSDNCLERLTHESLSKLSQEETDTIRNKALAQLNALEEEMVKKREYVMKYRKLIGSVENRRPKG